MRRGNLSGKANGQLASCLLTSVLLAACAGGPQGLAFFSGKTVALQDLRGEDFEYWRRRAEHGNGQAQFNVGFLYLTGRGIERDQELALDWYERAALAGHRPALDVLRLIDEPRAERVYSELAARREASALSHSIDPTSTQAETFAHWQDLAEKGDPLAEAKLAYLYVSGRGVKRDIQSGRHWYGLAGEHGNIAARRALTLIDEAMGATEDKLERELIRALQLDLASLKLKPGPAGGVLGDETIKAIRGAQEILGITPDGLATPSLLTALANQGELIVSVLEERRARSERATVARGRPLNIASKMPDEPPESPPSKTAASPPPARKPDPVVVPSALVAKQETLDTIPPVIRAPKEVALHEGVVTFSGLVEDDSRIAELRVDGDPVGLDSDGRFSLRRRVSSDTSELILSAADEWGNETRRAVAIRRIVQETIAARDYGRFHALVIGINSYIELPALETAVHDAQTVAQVLETNYDFDVTLLLDAKRTDIRRAMALYRRNLSEDDNLLIYYAGHGWNDEQAQEAYWLPVDAEPDDDTHWISNSTITTSLRAIEARHVLVVADSCFSGTLTRGLKITLASGGYASLAAQRSRTVLTAGGNEPVVDAGKGGHSVFASEFIKALQRNRKILDATSLFVEIRRPIMINARQTPQYGDIRGAGHEGGDFLFIRTSD
jgi:uncharacterized caspase-like protein